MFENCGTTFDKTGVLTDVDADYIVMRQPLTNELIICDVNSVKFVSIVNAD